MDKDPKLAPLISFNNHFKYDHNSDEELLVVNSPLKKPEAKHSCVSVDKECMTEQSEERNFYLPHNLNITFKESSDGQVSTVNTKTTSTTTTNALIIGEIPINLNDIYNNNQHETTKSKTMRIDRNDSSQLSVGYIDSPVSTSTTSFIKTPIIPYLILPFSNGIKKLKNENLAELSSVMENQQTDSVEKNLVQEEKQKNKEQVLDEHLKESSISKSESKVSIEREQWAHKTEFLLAIIGFSVDLGNIWRFPKVVYENQGGRFLIPYFVQLAFCGLPLFYMELALGQYHQTGLFTLMEKICPLLKGVAFTAFTIDLFMAMFYNTVIAWAVYYLFLSFKSVVPWKDCNKPWNTLCCLPISNQIKYQNFSASEENYQIGSDESYIYKVYNLNTPSIDKRIVIFNNKNSKQKTESVKYQAISEILKFMSPNAKFSSSLNYQGQPIAQTNSTRSQIDTWIGSYNILLNETIIEAPRFDLPTEILSKYIHDPLLLTTLIEEKIEKLYANQSVNIFLNCEKNFKNPTQEFYTRYLTEMHKSTGLDDLGGFKWEMIVCLLIVFLTVYFALWKGIKSAGKAVWITAIAPYIVLFILLIRGLTLEGSWIGISFYLTVNDWSSLLEMKVWVDAATQIFFSLGPGFGTIIALSSYNKKTNNCYKDALLTSFINCFTSILSGFVVFSTLGHMAHVQGKSIQEVTEPGPGLIFVTYPQAISLMPWAPLWAVIFFFMLFTLGIDSTFGGLEAVITGICDSYPRAIGHKRSIFVLCLILLCFVAALPTVTYAGPYIVHLFDSYAVAPSILIVVFLEILGVMYAYGCDRFCSDLKHMIKTMPKKFWIYCWKYISPAIVLIMTLMICKGMLEGPLGYGNDYVYEGLGSYLAALIVGVPTSFIFIYAAYRMYQTEGTFSERFYKLIQPGEPWNKDLETLVDGNCIKLKKIQNSNPKYIIVNFNQASTEPVNL